MEQESGSAPQEAKTKEVPQKIIEEEEKEEERAVFDFDVRKTEELQN